LEKVVTPAEEREAVAHLMADHGMSERRACRVLGCCRMTARYQTVRVDDVDLREAMKALAHKRHRFGYRRLHVLLRRGGHALNCYPAVHVYMHERAQTPVPDVSRRKVACAAPG
jgi:putative transposase